ncbi:MAG: DUF1559 domain-containing protein [Blastopirellula sp. JB062]
MPISFTCPHCGTSMEVDEKYAGQTGPCAICAKSITIPAVGNLTQASEQETTAASTTARLAPKAEPARMPLATLMLILGFSFGGILVLAICGGGIASFAVPAIKTARRTAQNDASQANLKRIAAAMQSYYDVYNAYPPAYSVDAKGKPLLSWRVLLLPYLGHQATYDRFRLDLPWDDPHNMAMASGMPDVYHSFGESGSFHLETRFVVIQGKRTLFPPSGDVSQDDVKDEMETLLLVVEKNGPGILWIQPDDLSLNRDTLSIENDPNNASMLTNGLTGNVVMANGDAFLLPDFTTQELMRKMATRDGEEEAYDELRSVLTEQQY